ncbi:4-alpha-glucanotransferase [Embleya sp. AB8]
MLAGMEEPRVSQLSPELVRLAAAFGVATEYQGWRGEAVHTDPATVTAVLDALGVDASTPETARAALAAHDELRRTRLLPPVLVLRSGRAAEFTVNVPTGHRVDLWIELEDGGIRRDLGPGPGRGPLGDPIGAHRVPADLPLGWHTLHARCVPAPEESLGSGGVPSTTGEGVRACCPVAITPAVLPALAGRSWGYMLQLYSLPSHRSWGIGDLADLADLAVWSARTQGAGFVLVNPLHAASPVPPVEPSPYLPVSRRFPDPMYVRVEAIPEFAYLTPVERAVAEELRAEAGDGQDGAEHLDRDAVRVAKREALALVHKVPRSLGRDADYRAFVAREGRWLTDFATWCALVEEYGPTWRDWPAELHDPDAPEVEAERERLAGALDFHRWTQWVLADQLRAAQDAATGAGMPVGIVHDLAVGVHPDGADAWVLGSARGGRVLALGATGGAPPDAMNQLGQDWNQPPWHPLRLAEAGYAPYRELLRAVFRHAGAVRVDHVLGLFRFWWVPKGNSPAQGAYVRYDHEAMVGILALEAQRAGAVVIGEDLGTVEPWVRTYLAERGILGTSVLWFERDDKGRPLPPEQWRPTSLATVTTHDLPPTAARLAGEHIDLWARLHLLVRDVDTERAEDLADRGQWLELLRRRGYLRPGAGERETVEALHRLLAATPCRLLGVWLPDGVGDRRPQNVPGTWNQYPNWLLPVADGAGRHVYLEDLPAEPRAVSLARAFRGV